MYIKLVIKTNLYIFNSRMPSGVNGVQFTLLA
jgi:hypothetical protein